MPPKLFRTPASAEYYFEEGLYILELLNDPADPEQSIARARLPAGAETRWHASKDTTERYLILTGQGVVSVGNAAPFAVQPGDVVLIAPMLRQRIRNTGATDLEFLAICTPRFRPENYRDDLDSDPD